VQRITDLPSGLCQDQPLLNRFLELPLSIEIGAVDRKTLAPLLHIAELFVYLRCLLQRIIRTLPDSHHAIIHTGDQMHIGDRWGVVQVGGNSVRLLQIGLRPRMSAQESQTKTQIGIAASPGFLIVRLFGQVERTQCTITKIPGLSGVIIGTTQAVVDLNRFIGTWLVLLIRWPGSFGETETGLLEDLAE